MSDTSLVCPHCKKSFPLTETLAAPFVERAKQELEAHVRRQHDELALREAALKSELAKLQTAKQSLDDEIKARLARERKELAERLKREATEDVAARLTDLELQLSDKRAKLAQAQTLELDLRRKATELEDEKNALALEVERRLSEERQAIREQTTKDVLNDVRLREAEKDKRLDDYKRQVEELNRKLEQGSQQLQGEVQELDLEQTLQAAFPQDRVEPVAKGQFGGDCIQRVFSASGKEAGTILWECKRTKEWSSGWLAKLRGDQRDAKADLAVILTRALPKEVERFGSLQGIWVTERACALQLAGVLRVSLIEVSNAKQALIGQQDKMALVYQYITGPEFRHRVTRIVEAFCDMKVDLDKERLAMQRAWTKREKQLQLLIDGTIGMHGDLQGIVGKSLPEIEALDLKRLGEGSSASDGE